MKKIFIITGEYSGDIHASKVVKELHALGSDVEIEGIGGLNLEAQGVKLFANQEKMSAVGLSPKILIDHYKLGKSLVNYLKNEYKPDLVLLIDYGAFNLSIARFLKKVGNIELNLLKNLWIKFYVFFLLKSLCMLNMV